MLVIVVFSICVSICVSVCVFCDLFSFPLVSIESEQGIFEEVLHGDLDFSTDPWPSISEGAKDLVRKMLIRDPKRRISAHDVLCEFLSLVCFHNYNFCV